MLGDSRQGGHSSGKPGKVRELKSGQGKVRENELLQIFSCLEYCSDIIKMISYTFVYIPILSHWHILENVVVIDMSVYMSVAERNKCIFLYRYCCEGRYSVYVPLKCL